MSRDQFDDLLDRLDAAGVDLDLDVEGIVDRVGAINKAVRRALGETLSEYGITPEDWGVLTALRLDEQATPGALARHLGLSSGAMTSRLDRLEDAGHIRRLADPDDRRGVRVELTRAGRKAWESAIAVQGRKEALFASALSKAEQRQLNVLLRKLVLAYEATASSTSKHSAAH